MADALPLIKRDPRCARAQGAFVVDAHARIRDHVLDRGPIQRTLGVQDSALYQALHRLEERGLTVAEWGVTENNQRARYYKLTKAGRTRLAAETAQWVQYASTVTGILTTTAGPA